MLCTGRTTAKRPSMPGKPGLRDRNGRSHRTCFEGRYPSYAMSAVDEWEATLADAGNSPPRQSTASSASTATGASGPSRPSARAGSKEYRDFVVVVGHEGRVHHRGRRLRVPGRFVQPRRRGTPRRVCWHAIAARIAGAIDAAEEHDMWYSDVREFLTAQRSVVPDPVDPPEFALQRTGGGTGLLADQPADRSR